MYDYHSARNMVQLIGRVKDTPEEYDDGEGNVVSFTITVRDRDDNYNASYTDHVVIAPELVAKRCTRDGVQEDDEILVKGRLNNFLDIKSGKTLSNVQAHEILSLIKHKDEKEVDEMREELHWKKIEKKAKALKNMGDYGGMLDDPRFQKGKAEGEIIDLLEKKFYKEVEEERVNPEFKYEDEDDGHQVPF